MTAKLTLNIDSKIIESAKRKSSKKGVSLSKIVEKYLWEFSAESNRKKSKDSAMEVIGIAGKIPSNFNYDEEMFAILKEKHL